MNKGFLPFADPLGKAAATQRSKGVSFVPIGAEKPCLYSVEDFERLTRLKVLSHLLFDTHKTYEKIKMLCKKAEDAGNISLRARHLGAAYSSHIDEGFVNDTYIRWIDNRTGLGLFANKTLKKGEYIGEYVGLVRPCTYFFANSNEYCFRYPLYGLGLWIYTIDAYTFCNETSFINHSDNPNCHTASAFHNGLFHLCIRASRPIERGEQLTHDYGFKPDSTIDA